MIYIKIEGIKKFAKEHNRQITKDFIESLDRLVENILLGAHNTWNGHHRRLTPDLLPKK